MTVRNKERTMRRSTADRLLEGIKERIILANGNEGFACCVDRAVVFGSYVNEPERDRIGDLDIAIRLVDRYPKGEMNRILVKKYNEAPGYLDELSSIMWYKEEIYRFIRNRSPYIQIMELDPSEKIVFSKGWMDLPVGPGEDE